MAGRVTHSLAVDQPQRPLLILIDDDHLIVESLSFVLKEDYDLITAGSREEALRDLRLRDQMPSLALVDLGLPPVPHLPDEGFALIADLLGFNPDMKILMLSGQNKRQNIQHALTLGAVDFVPKPCDIKLLKTRLMHQCMLLDAEKTAQKAQNRVSAVDVGLVGESAAMETLRSLITQFTSTPFPVLIEGESGVGKELVAEALHKQGDRGKSPFLSINCAAFPADLLEAQLFGHAKGAFTGADSAKPGFFEEADQGSLFLDEIGELPIELQAKLLRVLENGEYYRIGETQARRSNARIIAATNRDLPHAVSKGAFRKDLYHRLGVLSIPVPPLRERVEDIEPLFAYFQHIYATTFQAVTLDASASKRLKQYGFPGNVRELRNIVIRLGSKFPGQQITLKQLENELDDATYTSRQSEGSDFAQIAERQLLQADTFHLDETLEDWEKRYIMAALKHCGGNLSRAARLLGVNRTTLYSKLQRLAITVDQ